MYVCVYLTKGFVERLGGLGRGMIPQEELLSRHGSPVKVTVSVLPREQGACLDRDADKYALARKNDKR